MNLKNKSGNALTASAIGNRLHDYPKPAYAGSRKADDGRLGVFVATN
jgi:hypothetical protein